MQSCKGILKEIEVLEALKQMKNGSASGIDGITVQFFKLFWNHIETLITSSFNTEFDNGNLSTSQRKAVIRSFIQGKTYLEMSLKT